MSVISNFVHRSLPFAAIGLIMALAATVPAVPQQLTGSVSGTVLDSRSQTPVSGIKVLVQGGAQSTTNEAGQFRISNVSPGTHIVQAVRSGWSTLLPDGSPATVTVSPGEEVRNLRLQLATFGIMTGKIRDSNGKPTAGVTVQAWVASYQQGRRVLVAPSQAVGVINSSTETDENGEYHLELPPGVYYVSSQYRDARIIDPAAARVLGNSRSVYYPGTTDVALAATIKLNGGEAPGIDFNVAALPGDLHKVYVRLESNSRALNTNMSGAQIAELRNRISLEHIAIVGSFLRGSTTSPEFVIDGVPDGSFDLFVDGIIEGGVPGRGVATIDMRGEDLRDVRVTLESPQDIAGRVSSADGSRTPSYSGVTVQVGTRRASADANGAFLVPKVPRGFHSVRVEGLPANAYVADIRYGGTSLHETARSLNGPELEAGLASTPMEVLIATNGGTVDGIVDGREAGATVVLVPPPSRRFVPSYYKTATAGPAGEFSIKGIAPGVYEVFAWDSVPDTAWLNPQFMSRWGGRGQTISVEAGGSSNVRPRLLHQED